MAKVGLNNLWISPLTAESSAGVPTYGTPSQPGKAVNFACSPEYNDASLYADDALAESDKGFKSASVTMEVDKEDITTKALILGHTVTDGEMISNADDVAPYLGVGRVITMIEGGVKKFIGKVLHKVKFSEPSEEEATKGENTEFRTTSYEGTAFALANGKWKSEKSFTDKDDAIEYVKTTLGYSSGG